MDSEVADRIAVEIGLEPRVVGDVVKGDQILAGRAGVFAGISGLRRDGAEIEEVVGPVPLVHRHDQLHASNATGVTMPRYPILGAELSPGVGMGALGLSFLIAVLISVPGKLASWVAGAAVFGLTLVLALTQPGAFIGPNFALAGLAVLGFNMGLCAVIAAKVLVSRPALTA